MELNKKKTGNRCGHDRTNPTTELVYRIAEKTPAILKTLSERIERFNRNRSSIPMLAASRQSKRTRRSESAESISLVLKCVVKYIDLVTFKVGFFNRGKWFNLSYKKIQEHTGLSKFRVLRAMAELQRVGLVGVHQVFEEITDQNGHARKIAKIAIKTVNLALFAVFGMEQTCVKERNKASKRRAKKKQAERTEAAQANLPDQVKGLKGIALAKATMQAAKYNAKQMTKKARKQQPSDSILIWDDGIPY
jgi:DNA-binding transcriptional regulator GbsR (MarR family)